MAAIRTDLQWRMWMPRPRELRQTERHEEHSMNGRSRDGSTMVLSGIPAWWTFICRRRGGTVSKRQPGHSRQPIDIAAFLGTSLTRRGTLVEHL